MPAESLFQPIPDEALRQARSRLAYAGLSAEAWAIQNGFKPSVVQKVLSGARKAIRGESFKIAIALGLRPDPDNPAPAHAEGLPAPHALPAGRTEAGGSSSSPPASLAGRGPAHDVNRPPVSQAQLAEPVR